MKLLLDTHPLLWMMQEPERLGERARRLILAAENELFVSLVSLWEIHLKISIGKLSMIEGWRDLLREEMRGNGIQWLALTAEHCAQVETLPWHHRDPFDRMLVAQAEVEGMTLLSKDQNLGRYAVEVVW
jgi:PIN domain nuclease of toxin-antitoxin system